MESGIYLARVTRVVIFADGMNSNGKSWIVFELTLDISIDGIKHTIRYRQPSWTFADIYAEAFGSLKNDFNNWRALRDKYAYVHVQEYEDPTIIEFL